MDDWLVGGVSLTLGIAGIAASITSADWPMRWSIASGLNQIGGRKAMRMGYLLGGIALIAIGMSILWKPPRKQGGSSATPAENRRELNGNSAYRLRFTRSNES